MIDRKKVIQIGGARYVGVPRDFETASGEKLVIIHDKLIAFATPEITDMTDQEFKAEVAALFRMLTDARRILSTEQKRK
jgi:hypothetical protein